MRILMINKFLFQFGGSETYMLSLGRELQKQGHEVQYFGMDHEHRIVGNEANSYTTYIDFTNAKWYRKMLYPFRIVYSSQARRRLRRVMDDFHPDVVHLNLFNFQLTPSIILEVVRWREENHVACKIIYTAHDYQLICPSHMMYNHRKSCGCEQCLDGYYSHCMKNRCIKQSFLKSLIGTFESYYWHKREVYRNIDKIICCSEFLKKKLDTNQILSEKTCVLRNFTDTAETDRKYEVQNYILYFGRYVEGKGLELLINICDEFSEIPFIFAGDGELKEKLSGITNVTDVGFLSGEALVRLISEANFTVCPSNWYENCPFSIIESLSYGTPVLGANIGGIPELIKDHVNGELFEADNYEDLKEKLRGLWVDSDKLREYRKNCLTCEIDTVETYTKKLLLLYKGEE